MIRALRNGATKLRLHIFSLTYFHTCCSTNLFLCFMLPCSHQYGSKPQSLDFLIPWLIRSDQGLSLRRATSRQFTLGKPYFHLVCPDVVCLHPGYTFFYFHHFFFRRQRHNPSNTKQKSSFFRTDCTWKLMKRSGERKLFTWLVHCTRCTGASFIFDLLWQLMQLMFLILVCNRKLDL